jgi:hypothetical protein
MNAANQPNIIFGMSSAIVTEPLCALRTGDMPKPYVQQLLCVDEHVYQIKTSELVLPPPPYNYITIKNAMHQPINM